jgi:hypothetical protein
VSKLFCLTATFYFVFYPGRKEIKAISLAVFLMQFYLNERVAVVFDACIRDWPLQQDIRAGRNAMVPCQCSASYHSHPRAFAGFAL